MAAAICAPIWPHSPTISNRHCELRGKLGRRTSENGRVEDGRGSLGHSATPRFPSPLIEPDVPISGIRLSDWLHRETHGEQTNRTRLRHGGELSFAPRHSNLRRLLSLMVFAGSSPITTTSPSSKAHQKSGPFPQPALPGFNGVGSEEAPIEGLASVRHSNGTCSFPAFRFHEWLCEVRREGISETRLTYRVHQRVDLLLLTFEHQMIG